jgi:hypothetical protein
MNMLRHSIWRSIRTPAAYPGVRCNLACWRDGWHDETTCRPLGDAFVAIDWSPMQFGVTPRPKPSRWRALWYRVRWWTPWRWL